MRSDNVTKGVQQAPHRSLMNALGMTEEEKNRPLIGIVNSYNEIVPGHMNKIKLQKRSSSASRWLEAPRLYSRQSQSAMVSRWDMSA